MTLLPGDVIATGTPDGVGAATGNFLKPGDRVEAEIEGIGVLANKIVKPWQAAEKGPSAEVRRPRPHAQRTGSTPRVRPSGAASHLDLFEQPAEFFSNRLD